MRLFLLAAATTLFAAAPAGAQSAMTPQEREAFLGDWKNWNHCTVIASVTALGMKDPEAKAAYDRATDAARVSGQALARARGIPHTAWVAETDSFFAFLKSVMNDDALLNGQFDRCDTSGMFYGRDGSAPPIAIPAPAPQASQQAAPAASTPLGYTLALSVNGQGGGVTYTRTNVPGQLTGRWALIDGSIKGEETATRAGGAAADGSLAGSYTTSGTSNGSRYAGRLSMTLRGDAVQGRIRFYDLAWDNGDRGFGLEEGPWLHVVYGAAATGLIFPAADGGGWELHWVGPDGSRIASGKVVWRGSLTGTHTATDVNAGTTFALEIAETSPGTLRVVLPGGFAGIALKAG